jgi:hypothetical protein
MKTSDYVSWFARLLDLIIGKNNPIEGMQFSEEQSSQTITPQVANTGETNSQLDVNTDSKLPSGALDKIALDQLKQIRRSASSSRDQGQRQIDEIKAAFTLAYPGHEDLISIAIKEGQECNKVEKELYKVISAKGKTHPEARNIRERVMSEMAWALPSLQKTADRAQKNYSRRIEERSAAKDGRALSNVNPRVNGILTPTFGGRPLAARRGVTEPPIGLHGSDIRALSASPTWTILIDETGTDFGPDAAQATLSQRGKFVGIVVPSSPPSLNALPKGWHAVDRDSNEEIDIVFQAVLDAEVGVLGVEVSSLPVTPNERWMDGVGLLVDWILRLLPVTGPTKIDVLVENRLEFTRGQQWQLVERDCLRRLALAFPSSAAWMDLNIHVIGKDDSAMNGYVDAIAYTWAGTSQSSKDRLKLSKLCGPCLLDVNSRDLLMAWDSFAQGVNLSPGLWWDLLPSAGSPSTMVGTLLWNLGVESQADASVWSKYLAEVRLRMAAGCVDLAHLGPAVDWLEIFSPDNAVIPPLMRLCWLTAKLARSNHMGAAETAWEVELANLSSPLVEENAPLVCHADLHLAVARTNRYDFEGASVSLEKWRGMPIAVPGLQYWGQVKSSLGQHAAFQGRNEEAFAYFVEAISAFQRLSDPLTREKEVQQTCCYQAIAMMDNPSLSDELVRSTVEKVTGDLSASARVLATDLSPSSRYAHHLLVRWLVHRGDDSAKSAYLSAEPDWFVGEGHPWPLIQMYRAILIHDEKPDVALQLALDGSARAFAANQGPVVRLIGATCRKVAVVWGEAWTKEAEELEFLRNALPAAETQINLLKMWNGGDVPALTLLKTVLPFNFR